MQQIFVANPKGGCGKTMLSVHLAAYFAQRGQSVALCDHDPQQSSLDWLKTRSKDLPRIHGIQSFSHNTMSNRFDVAIHDMPAACGVDDLSSRVQGHQLLIPVLAAPTDIKACVRFLLALNRSNLVENNQNRIGLVGNRVNVRTNYFKVLIAFLDQINLPLIAYLRDTQNYIRAFGQGASIFDLPQRSVTQDLCQWQSMLEWLDQHSLKNSHPFMEQVSELLSVLNVDVKQSDKEANAKQA